MGWATPEKIHANELLRHFWESDLARLEVTRENAGKEMPELTAEEDLDFERVRNRFRIMANLNPVRNRVDEKGTIRFGFVSGGEMRHAEAGVYFPGGREEFFLERRSAEKAP